MTSMMRKFDLNVESVLEYWEVYHALREVISNALDEQRLTKTNDIVISKDSANRWHIRDYGRGLKYEHLTQKEDEEKALNPKLVIGKFGVGLKDALATFNRHGVDILIKSKHGEITIEKSSKHGFEDIVTLHALISKPKDKNFIGTEFILEGLKDEDIDAAKDLFLDFSDEHVLEHTQYGQVLDKKAKDARIYINGLKVADEHNFLFSYNITSLTKAMRKALNRERTNVGRSAYSDRIKAILLECRNKEVAEYLVKDLARFEKGKSHDELNWIDVSAHACKLLNSQGNVIFLTSFDLMKAKDVVDNAENDGFRVIIIPENVKSKIGSQIDYDGNLIRDLDGYITEWNDSFEFRFVDEMKLTKKEKQIFGKTMGILNLIGGQPKKIKHIMISETMRMGGSGYSEAVGVWEKYEQRIIIKRDQLNNLKAYAGTLLHEVAHARSDAADVSREFENELTTLLGMISAKHIA